MGRTILIVVIALVLVAGTGAGAYAMGDKAGFQQANSVRQQFLQSRQAEGGQAQGGGFGGNGGNFAGRGIQGTIKSINGDTLVITIGTRDVTVTLGNNTQVEQTAPASKSDLTAGARVMVTGQQGSNGSSLTATTVLVLPAQ